MVMVTFLYKSFLFCFKQYIKIKHQFLQICILLIKNLSAAMKMQDAAGDSFSKSEHKWEHQHIQVQKLDINTMYTIISL